MYNCLEIFWKIKFPARWHVGAGLGMGKIDNIVVRDPMDRPFIPGSTLKGIIRNNCERIAASLHFEKIQDPNDPLEIANFGNKEFIVDRLFGSPYFGETLFFRNAFLSELSKDSQGTQAYQFFSMVLTRHKRDRVTGISSPTHLYTNEEILLPKEIGFNVHITGYHRKEDLLPPLDKEDSPWRIEYSLLLAGILWTHQIGNSKSRGLGKLETFSLEVFLNGQKIEDPLRHLHDLSEIQELSELDENKSVEDILQEYRS